MNIQTFIINAMAVTPAENRDITAAKKSYVKLFPECALCGERRGLEVHHVQPVHLFKELACDHHNMITLCDNLLGNNGCHNKYGHFRNFSLYFNMKIREMAVSQRYLRKRHDVKQEYLITTDQMIEFYAESMHITVDEFTQRALNFRANA